MGFQAFTSLVSEEVAHCTCVRFISFFRALASVLFFSPSKLRRLNVRHLLVAPRETVYSGRSVLFCREKRASCFKPSAAFVNCPVQSGRRSCSSM